VLEYLGRSDVQLMDTFFEGWAPQGREVFYRPVEPSRRRFIARVAPDIRATLEDVKNRGAARLLDVRSVEEFVGEWEADERPGHIPGAVNVPWDELVGTGHRYLESMEGIERRLAAVGISAGDSVIAYCAVGVRASVAYLALRQLGLQVRLYDGSFAEWTGAALPVEIGPGT
jgi:thiosulfate/3-mercaptopyruvate sulfurtransferase